MNTEEQSAVRTDNIISPIVTDHECEDNLKYFSNLILNDRERLDKLESSMRFLKEENKQLEFQIVDLESQIEELESQLEEVKDIAEGAYSCAEDEAELGKEAYEIAWEERIKLSLLILRVDEIEEAIE